MLDPKAISKEALYGTLDPNTREWTDGLFTHTLRSVPRRERSLARHACLRRVLSKEGLRGSSLMWLRNCSFVFVPNPNPGGGAPSMRLVSTQASQGKTLGEKERKK